MKITVVPEEGCECLPGLELAPETAADLAVLSHLKWEAEIDGVPFYDGVALRSLVLPLATRAVQTR